MISQNLQYPKTSRQINLFFWVIAFFSFLPFFILAFFSHPGSEDFTGEMLYQQMGFWGHQQYTYATWSGRFFLNFLTDIYFSLHFISSFYYLHTLILFFLTGAAAFFLINSVNKYLLEKSLSKNQLLQTTAVLVFVNIYLSADVANKFYWFSSAIFYQPPIILVFVIIGLLLKRSQQDTKKTLYNIIIAVLLILLMGSNEAIAMAVLVLLFFSVVLSRFFQPSDRKIIYVYFLLALILGVIVFSTSGILNRKKVFMPSNTHLTTVIPIIAFRTFMVFYHVFKEPLFWISFAICFFSGTKHYTLPATKKWEVFIQSPRIIYYSLAALIVIVMAILTPLLIVSKGPLPDRALDNIVMIAALCLLMIAFVAGQLMARKITLKINPAIPVTLVCISLLFSTNYITAWKSVCSGYFYKKIMDERDKQLMEAKNNHQTSITISSYNDALTQKLRETFPQGGFKSLNNVITEPPVSIYFFNEAEDSSLKYYPAYYGLEKIIIKKNQP